MAFRSGSARTERRNLEPSAHRRPRTPSSKGGAFRGVPATPAEAAALPLPRGRRGSRGDGGGEEHGQAGEGMWGRGVAGGGRRGARGLARAGGAAEVGAWVAERSRGGPRAAEVAEVVGALAQAAKELAAEIAADRLPRGGPGGAEGGGGNATGGAQTALDVRSNEVVRDALERCAGVQALASEEEQKARACSGSGLAVVFDPLDGSRNVGVAIPTGTIFGAYAAVPGADPGAAVLRPGRELLLAGYALYSCSCLLVLALPGSGVHGFTLDAASGEFLHTHEITIPDRGQIYSLNDAREPDWPEGLRRYIHDVRAGRGQSGKQYSARYVCSLVADFHRTLLQGGWAGNPRAHLRLVYEANPVAFLAEEAGGSGSTGVGRILDLEPRELHQRTPLFAGSADDIAELESYRDVQQLNNPGYKI